MATLASGLVALTQTSWAQSGPAQSCLQTFVANLARSYACQRIINALAVAGDRNAPMVIKLPAGDKKAVVFLNKAGEEICGRVELLAQERRFDKSATVNKAGDRLLEIGSQMANAVNREDLLLQGWALRTADSFMPKVNAVRDIAPATRVIEALQRELQAMLAAHKDAEITQACAIRIGGAEVMLPRASGPDLTLLRANVEARDTFGRFDVWLTNSLK